MTGPGTAPQTLSNVDDYYDHYDHNDERPRDHVMRLSAREQQ
jgi:hypothetical protein